MCIRDSDDDDDDDDFIINIIISLLSLSLLLFRWRGRSRLVPPVPHDSAVQVRTRQLAVLSGCKLAMQVRLLARVIGYILTLSLIRNSPPWYNSVTFFLFFFFLFFVTVSLLFCGFQKGIT